MEETSQSYKFTTWEGSSKKLNKKNVFSAGSQVMALRFDPEDTMLAAGCSDGTLKIFHIYSGNLKLNIRTSGQDNPDNSTPCTALRWRPTQYSDKTKNVLVSTGADGKIIHWHITTGKELSTIQEENNQINALDFNQDGTQFVTTGSDNIIRIYDEETLTVSQELKAVGWKDSGHVNRVFCVKFIPDQPELIMSGGWDQNVHIWDKREKKAIKSFIGPKVSGESLDFKNGKILSGSNSARDQLALWDFGTMEKIQDIDWEPNSRKENGAFVYGCQFSKTSEESILVGAHGVNSARIFDAENNYRPFGTIESSQGVYTVDYGNYSNKFAAAGADGQVYVASLVNENSNNQ